MKFSWFKYGIGVGLLFLLLLSPLYLVAAAPAPDYVTTSNSLLFGQDHAYSVFLRGNGEAIVQMRATRINVDKQPIKSWEFSFPFASPDEPTVFQELSVDDCNVIYEQSKQDASLVPLVDAIKENSSAGSVGNDVGVVGGDNGVVSSDIYPYPCYTNTYLPAETSIDGQVLTVTLPSEVAKDDTAALLVAFATDSFTRSSFGRQTFDVRTLQVDERLQSVRVGVSVETGYSVRSKDSKVDYADSGVATDTASYAAEYSALGSADQDARNQALSNIAGGIGYGGVVYASSQSLAAGESLSVTGVYAKHQILLYLEGIGIVLVVLGVITLIIYGLVRGGKNKGDGVAPKSGALANTVLGTHGHRDFNQTARRFDLWMWALGSAVVLFLVLMIMMVLVQPFYFEAIPIGGLLLVGIFDILCMFIVFALPVTMAAYHGLTAALVVFCMELLWYVVGLVLYLTLFAQLTTDSPVPYLY